MSSEGTMLASRGNWRLAAAGWLLAALSVCGTARAENPVIIDNYPQHGTEPDAVQTERLRGFARAIAGALVSGQQIDVTVAGHADNDALGDAFEMKISLDRANSGEGTVRRLVREQLGAMQADVSLADTVNMSVMGLGNSQPIHSPAVNDAQRRANRRVQFFWSSNPLPRPSPTAQLARCPQVLASSTPPGPVRRMTCVCNVLSGNPRALDYAWNYPALQRARTGAPLDFRTWTPEFIHNIAREGTWRLRSNITKLGAGASDADFANALILQDEHIGASIASFFNVTVAHASAPDIIEKIVAADIGMRMLDPNHIYSCYAGYSRAAHAF